jgi:hypothetical protein
VARTEQSDSLETVRAVPENGGKEPDMFASTSDPPKPLGGVFSTMSSINLYCERETMANDRPSIKVSEW